MSEKLKGAAGMRGPWAFLLRPSRLLVPGAQKEIGTRLASDIWLVVVGVLCLEERKARDRHKDKSREPSRA